MHCLFMFFLKNFAIVIKPSPSPFPIFPLKNNLMFYSYMYEVARRNPFVFAPVLLAVAAWFEEAATTCCEQQQKATCFQAKVGTTLISSRG